jgi:transcriptional regulator with XRE-family HTH domain
MLSQEETAVRASLHRTEISMLECGDRLARIDTLVKLVGALEASPGELLDGISWLPGQMHGGAFSFSSPQPRRPGRG